MTESMLHVVVLGAGPAGLAAAHELSLKGYKSVIYEADSEPGGMLRSGIPAYRLPRKALDAEIETIRRLGARFQMGSAWGTDFTLETLRPTKTPGISSLAA